MLQDILLEHCYPTLSNLKFANMINVDYTDSIFEDILKLNEKLSEYNFSLIILKQTRKKLLLYLINYNLIENYNDKRLQNALKSYGYPADNFNSSINFLKKRLLENEFPHEIGFFLGCSWFYQLQRKKWMYFRKVESIFWCRKSKRYI